MFARPACAASRLLLVAAAYAVALVVFRRAVEFSFTSPWFALIAMVCFLGLVDSARPLFLLRMPRCLREVRAWEEKGTVYRALGVPAFGVLLRRTPLRALNREVYLRRRPGDRARVVAHLEAAEAAHALDALLVIPYMAYAGTQHWWIVVFWFTLAQTVVNLYPVMHLRWARGRLIEHSCGKSAQNTA